MTYEPVIGLEVHVQTKTKSKMFCGCSTDYFNASPNTHTCPTCLGLPGALPVPNKAAIDIAVKIALALNCSINKETKFDRKNYFYPDLPKGYQISQYDQPIGENGNIEINTSSSKKKIGITRVHQEEDTGKSLHEGELTLLDYNKSGVPLVEIVTEPDFRSAEEVVAFARVLQPLLRYLEASDADMEKGQMRFEPNMSLRVKGESKLPPYKVEVKNIGSIAVLANVIEKEIARQTELLEKGETPQQETRGLVDMTGETISQRIKETEADYRYFPEPDIPPIVFDDAYIDNIRSTLPELPEQKLARYVTEFKIPKNIADTIVSDHTLMLLFESSTQNAPDNSFIQETAKWVVGDVAKLLKKYPDSDLDPQYLVELIALLHNKKITRTLAKDILEESFIKRISPQRMVETQKIEVISDEAKLESIAATIISANPQVVKDTKKNPNAIMFLVGQVMKEMKGKADPKTVRNILEKKLSK